MNYKELTDFIKNYDPENGYECFENMPQEASKCCLGNDMFKQRLCFDYNKMWDNVKKNEITDELVDWMDENCIEFKEFETKPKTVEELHQMITDLGFNNISVFDGKGMDYITACIGIDMISGRVVYDYTDMVAYMIEVFNENSKEDFDALYSQAVEWIDYNTIRALPYFENSPIILDREIPA